MTILDKKPWILDLGFSSSTLRELWQVLMKI